MKHFILTSSILIWSLFNSGCRIGNQVVPHNPEPTHSYSGYYSIQPHSLIFYTRTTHNGLLQKTAPFALIPKEIATILTNPVGLAVENAKTGKGYLFPPGSTKGLPTLVNADLSIAYTGSTAPRTLWLDENCKRHLEIREGGRIIPKTQSVHSENAHPLSGSLEFRIRVEAQFTGNCTASFQAIARCYDIPSECEGEDAEQNQKLQALVQSIFGPYIQSQTLKVEEIPDLENYGYEITYE